MGEINRMIAECADLRTFYRVRCDAATTRGERSSAGVEALAVSIRERALLDAKQAIQNERK